MERIIIDIPVEESRELTKLLYENSARRSVLQMLINSERQNEDLINKYMVEYVEAQTNAELMRQDILDKYTPEDVRVIRYNVDSIASKLIIIKG